MTKEQMGLKLLQENPQGLSSAELAANIGYKVKSIGKMISRLRQQYEIPHENHRYVLKGERKENGGGSSEATPKAQEEVTKDKTLNDRFIDILLGAGLDGISRGEVAKKIGVKEESLSYHSHKARKKRPDLVVTCINKQLRALPRKKRNGQAMKPAKPTSHKARPSVSGPINVRHFLDRDLLKGLTQIDPADMSDYLELLRKSTLYKIWGVVSVEVNKELKRIEEEALHAAEDG